MAPQAARMAEALAPVAVALAGLAALAVAMGIGRFAFTPILPMMHGDSGLTLAAGGWLASANYIGYLLGALWAAWMPARAAVAIRAGLAAIALSTLGMSLDTGIAGWAVLRAIAGIASAWVLIHVSAWCLERLAPARSPLLEGALFAGVGIGIVAAGVLCLALMSAQAGSATAWWNLGLLSLAATVAMWSVFDPAGDVVRPPSAGRGWSRGHARLVLAYGTFGFGYIIPATFIPMLAKQLLRDPLVFGWAWPLFGAAAAVSTLAVALAAKRIAARTLWPAAQFVMAFGVIAPLAWPGIGGILLAALCVGGTFMVITMAGMQEARRIAAPQAAGLMAAMTAAFATGQIAGPLLMGFVLATGGGLAEGLWLACAVLVAGACALLMRRS